MGAVDPELAAVGYRESRDKLLSSEIHSDFRVHCHWGADCRTSHGLRCKIGDEYQNCYWENARNFVDCHWVRMVCRVFDHFEQRNALMAGYSASYCVMVVHYCCVCDSRRVSRRSGLPGAIYRFAIKTRTR